MTGLRRYDETREMLNLARYPTTEWLWECPSVAAGEHVVAYAVLEVYASPNLNQTIPVAKRIFRRSIPGREVEERVTTSRVCGELAVPGGWSDRAQGRPQLLAAVRAFRDKLPWYLEHDVLVPKIFIPSDTLEASR